MVVPPHVEADHVIERELARDLRGGDDARRRPRQSKRERQVAYGLG